MTTLTNVPTPENLVAQLEPIVRKYTAAGEAERRLSPEVMNALTDAGIFRTWLPRAYGGLEMDPVPALELFEGLARVDGSVGWVASNSSIILVACQVLADEGSAEMFADPRSVVAGAWNPPGSAVPVEGGYRVTGQWPFSSACHYAQWLSGLCLIMDGDTPRLGADGNPVVLVVFVEASEAEILDTWYTLGMRGTGSHDFRVTDVFVPARRTFIMSPFDNPGRAYSGPLYRLGIWLDPVRIAVTGLGIASAALDDFVALALEKTPSYTQTGLADRSVVQDRVARARALIDAGRSYIHTAVDQAFEFAKGGSRITTAEGLPVALAGTFGMDAAVTAVNLIQEMAGATGFRDEHRFQRYFRDIHTVSRHAFVSTSRFESLGKLILGRRSDWAFHYV